MSEPLLGKREIDLPPTEAKTNWPQSTCMLQGLLLFTHVLRYITFDRSVKDTAALSPQSSFWTWVRVLGPRFIAKSMFYTQSVVRSLQSILILTAYQTRAILFTNTTLNRLGFGRAATRYFHFRNNETDDMLVYQSSPMAVEFFCYVNTFVGFMLLNLRTEI